MMKKSVVVIAGALSLLSAAVHAETLVIAENAPWWQHLGASTILILHIVGGTVGILTGWIASFAQKGQKLHRISGQTFFVAMFVSYLIAACVAPFLDTGARPNTVAGILALYLLLTGIGAARRRHFQASIQERIGLGAALFVTGMGVWFAWLGFQSDTGTVDGSPPQAFAVFILTGCFAVYGEVRVLLRRQLSNVERVRRHLWRMCASFFIASASFFVGQPQVFPVWFNETPLPNLLSFAPLLIMIYFLVRFGRVPRPKTRPKASTA